MERGDLHIDGRRHHPDSLLNGVTLSPAAPTWTRRTPSRRSRAARRAVLGVVHRSRPPARPANAVAAGDRGRGCVTTSDAARAQAARRRPPRARGPPRPPRRPHPRGVPARRRPPRGRARRHPGGDDRDRARDHALRRSRRRSPPGCYRVATNAALDELPAQAPPAGPRPIPTSCPSRSRRRSVDRRPGRRPHRRRRRAARRSPRSSGSRSCCATCATSTTPRSPTCSTSRPAPCGRASPGAARMLADALANRRRPDAGDPGTPDPPSDVGMTMADDDAPTTHDRRSRRCSRSSRSTRSPAAGWSRTRCVGAPTSRERDAPRRLIAAAAAVVVVLVVGLVALVDGARTATGDDTNRRSGTPRCRDRRRPAGDTRPRPQAPAAAADAPATSATPGRTRPPPPADVAAQRARVAGDSAISARAARTAPTPRRRLRRRPARARSRAAPRPASTRPRVATPSCSGARSWRTAAVGYASGRSGDAPGDGRC